MGYIKTLKEAEQLLSERVEFNAGTLEARWVYMGADDHYIVTSYGVEIADYDQRAIHPKAYTHSKTTSKHANIVKRAWGLVK
jgi:hypothetical protein